MWIFDAEVREAGTNDLYATVRTGFFIVGLGGFGHKGVIDTTYPEVPTRKPDMTSEETTLKNQAFLYRLSGDINPLHVDPNMAKMGGFKIPILHGLCTKGNTIRAV